MTKEASNAGATTLELAAAGTAHAAVLAALHQDGFTTPWSEQTFAGLLAQTAVHGLIAGQTEPAGFILYRIVADEAEILTLSVGNHYRRTGLATKLLTSALNHAITRGAIVFHLEVAADNLAAIALYRAAGFVNTGRRSGYYARPGEAVDALLMAKTLS